MIIDLSALSVEERREAYDLLREKELRKKRNRLSGYKPYGKQQDFHAAGAQYRERLFMAANQCLSPWTWVETPESTALSGEVFFEAGARVQSWGGESRCVGRVQRGYLKGIEPAFRLVLDNGGYLDCSANHRILTESGWLSLAQIVSLASGLRWSQTAADYQASCVERGHLRDPQLPLPADSAPAQLLAQAGVQVHSLSFSLVDAAERVRRHTSASPDAGLNSSPGEARRRADLFGLFAGPAHDRTALPLTDSHRELVRLARESGAAALQGLALQLPAGAELCLASGSAEYRAAADTPAEPASTRLSAGRSLPAHSRGCLIEELFQGDGRLAIFYPWKTPTLVGGVTIEAIVPIGYQPIVDCSVPDLHNYIAAGVISHNSGKTYSGAFEVAMHATGRYPDWWAGVRFPRATRWMIGSESAELTRKGQQRLLLGPPEIREEWGTGAIPHECLVDTSLRAGVADAVASCIVKHVSGENSVIQFNSYDQGRMQHVDSLVLTPTGWARIGDLRVGDEIIAGDGTTTRVTGVFPHGVKALYELTFDSGVRTLAGAEHLWLAAPRTNGSFRVMSTQDMIDRYGDAGERVSGNIQISTPTVGAVQFPHKDVPLDPYLVGALLGDGCMRGGRVRFTSADPEIAEHVRNGAEQVGAKMAQWSDIQYGFREAQRLHKHLEELGIAGRKAYEKHIPDIYLWNSPQIRLAVLQGLLDTDGSVSPRGTITFASTSQELMRNLAFLVRSLGGKARVKETTNNRTRPLFRATLWLPGVQAFRLQRKLERCVRSERETNRHILRTIRKVDSAEAVCIAVEHESRLYVTDDFIVTHNTKWQADTVDGVWLDEEPPMPIYSEALTRTNATGGMVFVTFTPLMGMSDVVRRFLIDKPDGTTVINMTVHDVEHYSPEQRDAIIASYPEHERDARTKGIPSMGSGRVFPLADEAVAIQPFQIPAHWPRIVGLDFGIDHPTAAVWMAWDRDTDTLYVTDIYRVKDTSIVQHAAAIRTRGEWIPVAWPHDGLQRDKGSGQQLAAQYKAQGLSMLKDRATFDDGSNGLEAGVAEMLQRMQTRRLRVFSHLSEWFEEFRLYHRKDGLIVAKVDDLMAATRYGMMMRRFAKTQAEVAPRGFIPPVVPFGIFDEVAGY